MPARTASWTLPRTLEETRTLVRERLGAAPAFEQLPPEEQRALAQQLVQVIRFVASSGGPAEVAVRRTVERSGATVNEVASRDRDRLVRLVGGVFQATVETSVEQLRTYAALVADAAKSLDAFAARGDGDGSGAPDELAQRHPDTFAVESSEPTGEPGAPRSPPSQRVAKGEEPDRRRSLGEVSRGPGLGPRHVR